MLWVCCVLPTQPCWPLLAACCRCRITVFLSDSSVCYTANNTVNFVSRHGIYFSRVSQLSYAKCVHLGHVLFINQDDEADILNKRNSPWGPGMHAQLCCARYNLPLCRFNCISRNVVRNHVLSPLLLLLLLCQSRFRYS